MIEKEIGSKVTLRFKYKNTDKYQQKKIEKKMDGYPHENSRGKYKISSEKFKLTVWTYIYDLSLGHLYEISK